MNYKRAEELLPKELLAMLQEYVDGECLYIPRRNDCKKMWGEKNGYKNELDKRNKEMLSKYKHGHTIKELAKLYFLSEKHIYKIIAKMKTNI